MHIKRLDNLTTGLFNIQARKFASSFCHCAIAPDDCLKGQVILIPPLNISHIAKRAAHHSASTLLRVCLYICHYRHLEIKQRYGYTLPNKALEAPVIWMNEDSYTGRQ